jgi:hypothetical protein
MEGSTVTVRELMDILATLDPDLIAHVRDEGGDWQPVTHAAVEVPYRWHLTAVHGDPIICIDSY